MISDFYTEKIPIYQKVQTADGVGGFSDAWEPLQTIDAKVRPLASNEVFIDQTNNYKITHKLFCAVDAQLEVGYGVGYEDKVFIVHSINNIFNHHLEVKIGEYLK